MNISNMWARATDFYHDKILEAQQFYLNHGDKIPTVRTTINQFFSPWTFAKEVTQLAEDGQAKPIESRTILDLSQFLNHSSWTESCSKINKCWRTIHFVNDPELIKRGLNRAGRSSHNYQVYPTIIDQKLDSNNMLLCPTKEHKRLRNLFDKIFTQKYFEEHFSAESTNQVITNYSVTELSNSPLLKKELITIINENSTSFSPVEKKSTESMFHIASLHTTSNTAKFILALLKTNPKWTRKICDEWKERFGEERHSKGSPLERATLFLAFIKGGEFKGKNVKPCYILHAFVTEALRLYPIIPQIVRVVEQDFKLDNTLIKKDDIIMFNVLGCQRNANVWLEPTKFNPGRFLKGDDIPNPLNFLFNFGVGSERCIGKHMAIHNLLVYAATQALIMNPSDEKIKQSANQPNPSYAIDPPFLVSLTE